MAETPTMPRQHKQQPTEAIKVTPRQVKAAQVAIEARKLLGRPIPPGLQRIAEAKRAS